MSLMLVAALAFNIRILATGGFISAKMTANISPFNMVFAALAVVAVLVMTKQAIGMAMVWVALAFLAYGFWGKYLPGVLAHNGITLKRMLSTVYLTNEGIYGSSLQISASEIFPLMMYGGIMVGLGGDNLLMGLAMKALGMFRGGIAKVAVLASALFGMLSGAGPANAATTGAFTIPMMKKYGYEAPFAGAVEATASVGGQIMPPIMGASAFIMAEYLGVSYGKPVLCAFPAAILYYFAIFLAVDIEAQKRNLTGLPREEIPRLGPVVKEHWHLMISVAVLIVLLVFCGYGPGSAGFYATVVMAVCEIANCLVRKKKRNLKELGSYIVDCTCNASSIAISCACAGIAKASPMKTAVTASKIGIAAYILPFLFVWYPGVLLQGTSGEIVTACIRSMFTIITVAVAFGGAWFRVRIPMWMSGLLIISAVCIFLPFTFLNLPSYSAIVGCFVWLYVQSRKQRCNHA